MLRYKRNYSAHLSLSNQDAMRVSDPVPKSNKPPRPPKQPKIHDFQFHPSRLQELLERENSAYLKSINYEVVLDKKLPEAEAEKARAEQEAKIAASTPLTEEENEEITKLLAEGFDWSRKVLSTILFPTPNILQESFKMISWLLRNFPFYSFLWCLWYRWCGVFVSVLKDFNAFVGAVEKFGRHDTEKIVTAVPDKQPDEVLAYMPVFWKRYHELANYDKLVAIFEKGEQRIQRKQDVQIALDEKIASYQSPFTQLKIVYGNNANRGRQFNEEEDRYVQRSID